MANTKSDFITNLETDPIVFSDGGRNRGNTYHKIATVEVAAADNNDHLYDMLRVHSYERIYGLFVANDAITAGTDYDCGFYDPVVGGDPVQATDKDGVALSGKADILFDGQTMATARKPLTDLFGVGTNGLNPEFIGKRVYEILGLAAAADPQKEYAIALDANTVGTAAGTITVAILCSEH